MARDFDGSSDLIACGDVDIDNEISVCVWIYADGWASGFRSVIAKRSNGGLVTNYGLNANTSILQWHYRGNDGWKLLTTPISNAPAGQWILFVGTFKQNGSDVDAEIIIDGISKATTTFTNDDLTNALNNADVTLGRLSEASSEFFDGKLFDYTSYNSILTTNQAKALFQGVPSFVIDIENQKQLLRLNGNDSPEPDISGNGNDGTLTGTTKSTTDPPVEFIDNY